MREKKEKRKLKQNVKCKYINALKSEQKRGGAPSATISPEAANPPPFASDLRFGAFVRFGLTRLIIK